MFTQVCTYVHTYPKWIAINRNELLIIQLLLWSYSALRIPMAFWNSIFQMQNKLPNSKHNQSLRSFMKEYEVGWLQTFLSFWNDVISFIFWNPAKKVSESRRLGALFSSKAYFNYKKNKKEKQVWWRITIKQRNMIFICFIIQ